MLKRARPLRRSVEVEEGLGKSSNKQHGETMIWRVPGGSWACSPPVYDNEWNHTATYAEPAPKSSQERIRLRVLQNAEKNKLVLDFYIPSTAHIHCYFILGRINKSPKHTHTQKSWLTIPDRTQSIPNTTSINIYISLFLSNHLWNLTSSSYHIVSLCLCVCVLCVHACVRACLPACVCACGSLFWLCFGSVRCNGLYAPIWRNGICIKE